VRLRRRPFDELVERQLALFAAAVKRRFGRYASLVSDVESS
jgi:hypothetical protein